MQPFSDVIKCAILILLETVCQIQLTQALPANKTETKQNKDFYAALSSMKSRWVENYVVNFEKSPELLKYDEVATHVTQLSNKASSLLKTLVQNKSDCYWPSSNLHINESGYLKMQFNNFLTLAMAYSTKGTELYRNRNVLLIIKDGLDYLTQPGRYDGQKYHGNWWNWQIGVPQPFLSIIFIIDDELSTAKKRQYANIISVYIPDTYKQMGRPKSIKSRSNIEHRKNYNTTGTNRVDIALSVIGVGILLESSKTIQTAVDSLLPIFDFVQHGEGFYEDGSFIYHKNVPYTASYGNELILGVSKIFAIVSNTEWQVTNQVLENFVSLTINSFLPLLINGDLIPMVSGRALSRPTHSGLLTPYNLLHVAELAQKQNKLKLQKAVKFWIQKHFSFYVSNRRDLKDLLLILNVTNDQTIDVETNPYVGSVIFGAMDRVVFRNSNYTAAISMYSSRISSFETGNNENKRGWHTSDGMLYLYNADQQFSGAYWPTVDPYRLPGTTVDTVHLEDETSNWQDTLSHESFAGGVTDSIYIVASMQLNKNGTHNNGQRLPMNLTAKKSWFMLGDVIIALGSDINGDTSATIETVIESRMLDENVPYRLINNKQVDVENRTLLLENNDWLLLQGPENNRSLGYIMLQQHTVKTVKEKRRGKSLEINEPYGINHKEEHRRKYQKILITHGSHVSDGYYAYAIVPNADKIVMTAVINRFKILENSNAIQAIYDPQQKLLAATVWKSQNKVVKGYALEPYGTFLIQDRGGQRTIALSNPKQTAEILTLKLPFVIRKIISTSSREIRVLADGRMIQVNTTNSLGKSFTIEVK